MADRLIRESDVRELFGKLVFTDRGQRIQFGMMLGYLLDKCPTAYNVDNVVNKLENYERCEHMRCNGDFKDCYCCVEKYIDREDAIEIVKGGGENE